MGWRSQLPSYLIVTVVAVLIWLWAAGETRETGERTFRVQFTTQLLTDDIIVTPKEMTITAEIEGSRSALRSAPVMGSAIVLTLEAGLGDQTVNLVRLLNDHPDLHDAGVSVISTDPPSQDVTIDRLVSTTVRVEDPDLGRLQTDGAIAPACRVKTNAQATYQSGQIGKFSGALSGRGRRNTPRMRLSRGSASTTSKLQGVSTPLAASSATRMKKLHMRGRSEACADSTGDRRPTAGDRRKNRSSNAGRRRRTP